MRALLLIAAFVLSGCAQTPAGKSVERAQYADLVSTGAALANGAREMNPLGISLVAIKPLIGRYAVDKRDIECRTMRNTIQLINPVFYGAATNNLAVAAGLAHPLGFGLVGALVYASWYPDAIDCDAPHDVQMIVAGFVGAYNAQDAKSVAALFSEDAKTASAEHRPHIEWAYAELFKAQQPEILEVTGPYIYKGDEYIAWLKFDSGWTEWKFEAENREITVSSL